MNMNNNEENWKDIEEYEGLYQISDKGRIKSIGYGKERILNLKRNTKGYLQVNLSKNGEHKWCLIHRLVALAFLSNPNNLPQVNHKDEDKTNNKVENLEWCDSKYNNNYGTKIQRQSEKISKPVLQYTKDGKFVKEWKSATYAGNILQFFSTYITKCCKGKCKSAYNFIWKYKK